MYFRHSALVDQKVISLYANGMSQSSIADHIQELYGINLETEGFVKNIIYLKFFYIFYKIIYKIVHFE